MLGNVEPISRTLKINDASANRIPATTLAAHPSSARHLRWGGAMLLRSVSSTYQFSALRTAEAISVSTPNQRHPNPEEAAKPLSGNGFQSSQSRPQVRPLQAWLARIGSLIWWSDFGKAIATDPTRPSPQLTWPSATNALISSSAQYQAESNPRASISSDYDNRSASERPDSNADVVVKVVRPTDQYPNHPAAFFDGMPARANLEQCLGWLPPDQVESLKQQDKTAYQIWLKEVWIGEVATLEVAHSIAQKLNAYLQSHTLSPEQIQATRLDGLPAIKVGDQVLFVANSEVTADLPLEATWMVIGWANNLRRALSGAALDMGSMQVVLYGFDQTGDRFSGIASWYGPYFHGRQTANGEIFDQNALTAAHPDLPLGTYLKVRNELNGQTVVVRVNDRGPYIGERSLDLSRAAAQCLGSEQIGVIPYQAEQLNLVQSEGDNAF